MSPKERYLDLISLCRSRHNGVCLDEIMQTYGVSHRTAQRMTKDLEAQFPDCIAETDDDGRKYWKLRSTGYDPLLTLTSEDLAVMDLAGASLKAIGKDDLANKFEVVQNKIKAHIPAHSISKIEPDLDALLLAQGFASKPYPVEDVDPEVATILSKAIKLGETIRAKYTSRAGKVSKLELAPYGLLVGGRRTLVAYPVEGGEQRVPLRYRLEALEDIELTGSIFERDPEFDLAEFSSWAFGSYYSDDEYGKIVWKFHGEAADRAASFRFHPDQKVKTKNGLTKVSFYAAGWLEMAWYLYQWGDQVEVVKPKGLRKMVEGFRRGDFPALP